MAHLKKTENNQGLPSNLQPTESLRNLSSEIARYFRKIEDLNVRLNRTRNEGDRQIYQAKLEEMVERMSKLQVELFLFTEQLEQMMQFCESLLSQDQLQSGEDHR